MRRQLVGWKVTLVSATRRSTYASAMTRFCALRQTRRALHRETHLRRERDARVDARHKVQNLLHTRHLAPTALVLNTHQHARQHEHKHAYQRVHELGVHVKEHGRRDGFTQLQIAI